MKLSFIKQLFIIVLLFTFYSIKAQFLVGINNTTLSIAPSYTVSNGTTITVTGEVKNLGTLPITDDVHVNLAIDTSSTSVPKYYWRVTRSYPVSNFLAGSTFSFSISDVASTTNGYKGGGGGGTTIVVWTRVGVPTNTITTADSAFSNIYIIDVINSTKELIESTPIYFNNPITETIRLNYDETVYTKIQLNDISGKLITEIWDKTLIVNELTKGLYLLKFWNEKQNIYIIKKIIIK